MKIIDITRKLDERTALWPRSVPFVAREVLSTAKGEHANLADLSLSPHAGTHADAPFHFVDGGARIGELPPETFVGEAELVDVGDARAVGVDELAGVDLGATKRILLKTAGSERPGHTWDAGFPFVTVEAARLMADAGVILVGIDTFSVDPFESRDHPAHRELLGRGVAILENLALGGVEPGRYELIALPLKMSIDGSPVRAVLRELRS